MDLQPMSHHSYGRFSRLVVLAFRDRNTGWAIDGFIQFGKTWEVRMKRRPKRWLKRHFNKLAGEERVGLSAMQMSPLAGKVNKLLAGQSAVARARKSRGARQEQERTALKAIIRAQAE